MTEMIDRVSQALLVRFKEVAAAEYGDLDDYPRVYIDGRFDLNDLARLAIQAMREPTEAMLAATGELGVPDDVYRDQYQAMIDEALK
jgi:hypothetical protein